MTDDVAAWLKKGLGCAAIFLKTHDSTPYREDLLHACTHNLTFDRQCEDSRAPYLLKLIEIANDGTFYRDGILSALTSDDEEMDLGQLFEIAGTFAARGDSEIKRGMYAAFDRWGFAKAGSDAAEELVRLDGMEGLLVTAQTFAQVDVWEQYLF